MGWTMYVYALSSLTGMAYPQPWDPEETALYNLLLDGNLHARDVPEGKNRAMLFIQHLTVNQCRLPSPFKGNVPIYFHSTTSSRRKT